MPMSNMMSARIVTAETGRAVPSRPDPGAGSEMAAIAALCKTGTSPSAQP